MYVSLRHRGAALAEVIVAAALLTAASLAAMTAVYQITLQERLHSRQVRLYWQSEALNARLQLLRSARRNQVFEWEAKSTPSGVPCRHGEPAVDVSPALVIDHWSHSLSCQFPVHRGRVATTENGLSLSVQWPRVGRPGWRRVQRYWQWGP